MTSNADIDSITTQVELEPKRIMIADTDNGRRLQQQIDGLELLLYAYRNGWVLEKQGKNKREDGKFPAAAGLHPGPNYGTVMAGRHDALYK